MSIRYLTIFVILGGIVSCLCIACTTKSDTSSTEITIKHISISSDLQEITSKNSPCTLQEISTDQSTTYQAKIKRRGGFSIGFPKHSYEIDLEEDISLAGLPADDDWILNSNYIDKTFIRHVMSYNIFREMGQSNRSSLCQFVNLQINKQKKGLYILMEKLDKSSLHIDSKDTMAFVFKEPNVFRKSYENIVPQKNNNFHQQIYPSPKADDRTYLLEELREVILSCDKSNSFEKISEYVDIENVIDWHLLLLISNNNDGVLKNFYLYKEDTTTPIRIAPWDYDHSFGRDGDGELNPLDRVIDVKRSILFTKLLESDTYLAKLKSRWLQHNASGILSKEGLTKRTTQLSESIRNNVNSNFEIWPIKSKWYSDDNGYDEEIRIIREFIIKRHNVLDKYFLSL